MASVCARVRRVKEDPTRLIDRGVVERACREAGHRWRERELDPVRTLEAFVVQIAHGNTAMAMVTRLFGGAFSESAYCQARARLPVAVVQAVFEAFTGIVTAKASGVGGTGDDGLWRGRRAVLIDGTGVNTPDTPALRDSFGTGRHYEDGCGLPMVGMLAVFDARSDLLLRMHAAPAHTGEVRHAYDLHPALSRGDVLVGDRAFCSYVHMAVLAEAGVGGVFRMSDSWNMPFPAKTSERERRGHGGHRRQEPLLVRLIDDQVVEIVKPHNRPRHLSPERFASIPSKMVVRVVRYTVQQPGWRSREIKLMTTLLDARAYPAAELAALYLSRWRIEINLRHLKRTMGMNRLKCRSVDGVRRELLMFALVYNAVCAVRVAAADAQSVQPNRISFIDALRWLLITSNGIPRRTETAHQLKIWPLRPPRVHPRRLKRGADAFPRMIRPRRQYIKDLTATKRDGN